MPEIPSSDKAESDVIDDLFPPGFTTQTMSDEKSPEPVIYLREK